jgi:hypothetical protein
MTQKMRNVLRVVVGLLFLGLGIVIGSTISIKKTYPFFRYKSISEYPIMQTIGFTIEKGSDGKFYHKGIYSERKRRQLVPWFGKEMNIIMSSDSIINFDSQSQFSGFDTSIVSFSGEEILPKCSGNTKLLVQWRFQVDTFYLSMKKIDGTYSIDVHK